MKGLILGVDPGLSGGLGWLQPGENPGAKAMPVMGKGLDVHAIVRLLRELSPALIVMEKAEMRPGHGSNQVATTFENYGILRGIFEGRFLPLEIVRPSAWKKFMKVTADKGSSIELCQRLFPTTDLMATERSRVPHDGMAEALLLAEYGRRNIALPAGERVTGEAGA